MRAMGLPWHVTTKLSPRSTELNIAANWVVTSDALTRRMTCSKMSEWLTVT